MSIQTPSYVKNAEKFIGKPLSEFLASGLLWSDVELRLYLRGELYRCITDVEKFIPFYDPSREWIVQDITFDSVGEIIYHKSNLLIKIYLTIPEKKEGNYMGDCLIVYVPRPGGKNDIGEDERYMSVVENGLKDEAMKVVEEDLDEDDGLRDFKKCFEDVKNVLEGVGKDLRSAKEKIMEGIEKCFGESLESGEESFGSGEESFGSGENVEKGTDDEKKDKIDIESDKEVKAMCKFYGRCPFGCTSDAEPDLRCVELILREYESVKKELEEMKNLKKYNEKETEELSEEEIQAFLYEAFSDLRLVQ